MPIVESQIDSNSEEYKRNRDKMLAAVAEFRAAEASVQATSEKSRERFKKRKQLMPRAHRPSADRGAFFLDDAARYRMHDDKDGPVPAAARSRASVEACASSRHRTRSGWHRGPPASARASACSRSLENKLPLVHLVGSGGANPLYQAEISCRAAWLC